MPTGTKTVDTELFMPDSLGRRRCRLRCHGRRHAISINQVGQFELHEDHVDMPRHPWPTRLDDEPGGCQVKRVTLFVQFAQLLQWVFHLQQRPMYVVPQAPEELLWCRSQIDDHGLLPKLAAILFAQDCAAPSCEHARALIEKL